MWYMGNRHNLPGIDVMGFGGGGSQTPPPPIPPPPPPPSVGNPTVQQAGLAAAARARAAGGNGFDGTLLTTPGAQPLTSMATTQPKSLLG